MFDLEADPGELRSLAGLPEYEEVEWQLRSAILAQFDPDALAQAGRESVMRRLVIKESLKRSGVHWDYFPEFDATKQYVR